MPIHQSESASILRETLRNWQNDRGGRLGAALAYYMALSLAPALVIVLAAAGWAFGAKAAAGDLVGQIRGWVGDDGAKVIETIIAAANRPSRGLVATLLGLVTLFLGATAVVDEMRDALNLIWKVPNPESAGTARTILNQAKERLTSFALVVGFGLLLLASMLLNVVVTVSGARLGLVRVPPPSYLRFVDEGIALMVVAAVIAVIFKVLPELPLRWSDVAVGAVCTAAMLAVGKFVLAIYLAKAGFTDTYGAAGSFVVLLVWIYYSAQIFYLGAEFTQVYTRRLGSLRGF